MLDKKMEKLWKKTKKKEYEDKIQKCPIIMRQRNEVIARMLYFQTLYKVESNAFMTKEMAFPLELNLP